MQDGIGICIGYNMCLLVSHDRIMEAITKIGYGRIKDGNKIWSCCMHSYVTKISDVWWILAGYSYYVYTIYYVPEMYIEKMMFGNWVNITPVFWSYV